MKPHILLDTEALSCVPGAVIIELGAVAFDPETGKTLAAFHREIQPAGAPFHTDLDTLAWHKGQGTFPRVSSPLHTISSALDEFEAWAGQYEPEAFWAWGATYDFPILTFAFNATGIPTPWEFWQCRCARTVWQLAFPTTKHAPRPHDALQDSKDALRDLIKAVKHLASPSPH